MTEIQIDFIENIDRSPNLLAGDTDSSYSLAHLPFSKFESLDNTVEYIQEIADLLNEEYTNLFNETVIKYGNVDPEYNLMNFKSEVVGYRGAFFAKKNYVISKLWDEGKFFDTPKLKKTGGQIVKADITQVTHELLTEIYNLIALDFKITSEEELCYKILIELKNKYQKKLQEAIEQFNLKYFAIPKKWGLRDLKTIPKQVEGAMLYNLLVRDTLRPGNSLLQVQIKSNPSKILQFQSKFQELDSKYKLPLDKISIKNNVISFPSEINEEEIEEIKSIFNQFDIKLDMQTILDFNIQKKLEPFTRIFSEETKRIVL